MATSFTNATVRAVGTTEVIVFTAPQKSIIIGCSVTNLTSGTLPIAIKVRNGVTDTYWAKDKRIDSGEPLELMKGNKLVLAAGEKLVVSSAIDSSMDVVLSVLQGVS
jgi:hypothetical protein